MHERTRGPSTGHPVQASLFGDPAPMKPTRARAPKDEHPAIVAAFEEWRERYPAARRGGKAEGLRAYGRAIRSGATTGTLDRQLRHYTQARTWYQQIWSEPAPLMNLTTFLNDTSGRGRSRYDTEPTPDSLRYWPPPSGHSWARARTIAAGETGSVRSQGRDVSRFTARADRFAR